MKMQTGEEKSSDVIPACLDAEIDAPITRVRSWFERGNKIKCLSASTAME